MCLKIFLLSHEFIIAKVRVEIRLINENAKFLFHPQEQLKRGLWDAKVICQSHKNYQRQKF